MSGNKRQFSKTGLILVGSMLVCLILCLAVGFGGSSSDDKNLDDDNTPGFDTVMNGGSPILIFDKRPEVTTLMAAFDEGEIVSVEVSCGGEPVESDSDEDITAVYKALKNVVIEGEAEVEASGSPIAVCFKMKNGAECSFSFDAENLYESSGVEYEISGTDDLIQLIDKMCKRK